MTKDIERRYSGTYFVILPLNGRRSVGQEALGDQELVWTLLRAEGTRPLPGNESQFLIVHSVA